MWEKAKRRAYLLIISLGGGLLGFVTVSAVYHCSSFRAKGRLWRRQWKGEFLILAHFFAFTSVFNSLLIRILLTRSTSDSISLILETVFHLEKWHWKLGHLLCVWALLLDSQQCSVCSYQVPPGVALKPNNESILLWVVSCESDSILRLRKMLRVIQFSTLSAKKLILVKHNNA